MGLSCSCSDEWDGDGWYWELKQETVGHDPLETEYFFHLAADKSRRCCSCQSKIRPGDLALVFKRYQSSNAFQYERLGWETVEIAPWYMCERCGEQYLNLEDLGYCIDIAENMFDLLAEYREMHGQLTTDSLHSGIPETPFSKEMICQIKKKVK